MSFGQNVDVIPPNYANSANEHLAKLEEQTLQKNKWKVLLVTFLLVLLPTLGWIWSQPAVYQSVSVIHFSYPQQIGLELSTVPEEQITLNQQRLTSFRVLQQLSEKLASDYQIDLDTEQLSLILSTEAQTSSRIINLMATGQDASILEPVLLTWLQLYLSLLQIETVENTSEDIAITEQKVIALEEKIDQQREVLQAYSEQHNIISLERDENRTLSKIKSLNAALDKADNDQTSATAALETIRQANARGKGVAHPNDKNRINQVRQTINALKSELKSIAERYTPEYMERDPVIKRKITVLGESEARLEKLIVDSRQSYLDDLQRTLEKASTNQEILAEQLDELAKQAKEFNAKLNEFKRLDNSVKQLETQAQRLKDQVIEKEVEKPFEARINVLEHPFEPNFPIGPKYILQSGIALASAAIIALLALLVFSFIVRHKRAVTTTNYNIVPSHSAMLSQQSTHALAHQQQNQLGNKTEPLALTQSPEVAPQRLLAESEVKALYNVANAQGKLIVSLIMRGVSPMELAQLSIQQVDIDNQQLNLPGLHSRNIPLTTEQLSTLMSLAEVDSERHNIWGGDFSQEDFDQMIINTAHDANLAFSEQLSLGVLQHTYLTFLVMQGARLNDLEVLAGTISPANLALYRAVNRQGEAVDIEDVNPAYPLL